MDHTDIPLALADPMGPGRVSVPTSPATEMHGTARSQLRPTGHGGARSETHACAV